MSTEHTLQFDITCSHCLEAIPAGTPYFPKIGEGCFHIHCPQTMQMAPTVVEPLMLQALKELAVMFSPRGQTI